MKKLAALMISLFMMAAAGQAFAASTKVCLAHFEGNGGTAQYTVQTVKNALKHCEEHEADNQVDMCKCTSNTTMTNAFVGGACEDQIDETACNQ